MTAMPPQDFTNEFTRFDKTPIELQADLVFWACVAGKHAASIQAKVNTFLWALGATYGRADPFGNIRAALDAGTLEQFLRRVKMGYDAPRNTPTGAKYRMLEAAFLAEADARGMTPAALDAQLWMHYSGRQNAGHLLVPVRTAP